jgi:hypothetical protein
MRSAIEEVSSGHLQTCGLLSKRIEDWGEIPSHEA